MSRIVSFFPAQAARNSTPVLAAMQHAAKHHGWQVRENCLQSDIVVIWSVLWHGRMRGNRAVYSHYQQQGREIVVVDVGTLWRGITWKIALGSINASGRFGNNTDLDLDRPRRFPLRLDTKYSSGDHILVAGQHQHSMQVQGCEGQERWISQQIKQLREHTARPIVIRSHPRSRLNLDQLPRDVIIQTPQKINSTYDDFDIDYSAHAVINFSSSPGILAAIHGTRPVVGSDSLAAPVGVLAQDIERSYDVDRESWWIRLCHTEYFLDEIESGLWIKRLGV